MVPPLTKKRKTDPSTPVVFATTGGMKPDARFNVLGREFHVHSALLKLHSAFFAKFLDSADKDTMPADVSSNAQFRYHWITKVDDDPKEHAKGGWFLIAEPKKLNDEDIHRAYAGDESHQQSCFEKLLCAIYSHPYSLTRIKQLETLVSLADYYRCLPILSHSINNALLHPSSDPHFITDWPCKVMIVASKLRHKLLFTEALIFAVGLVECALIPAFEAMTDIKIKNAAKAARSTLMAKIVNLQQILAEAALDGSNGEEKRKKLANSMSTNMSPRLPRYFRHILKDGPWRSANDEVETELEGILKSNLQFIRDERAGEDDFEDTFFCVEIADDDLPWHVTGTNWQQ